jgi:hypothetical protein
MAAEGGVVMWVTLTYQRECNHCHAALHADTRAWKGDRTGYHWCEPCAQELALDGGVPVARVSPMTAFGELLAQFRAKHAPRPVRSWTEREE